MTKESFRRARIWKWGACWWFKLAAIITKDLPFCTAPREAESVTMRVRIREGYTIYGAGVTWDALGLGFPVELCVVRSVPTRTQPCQCTSRYCACSKKSPRHGWKGLCGKNGFQKDWSLLLESREHGLLGGCFQGIHTWEGASFSVERFFLFGLLDLWSS